MMMILQRYAGKYLNEFIYSTTESLIGFRGLYNIGFEESLKDKSPSRFSFGGEIYYGALNKSPGCKFNSNINLISIYDYD